MKEGKVINRPRACARESGTAIRCREAYFRAWRIAKFGGDFDPVRVAVDEAVAAFSSGKDEAGRKADRSLWLKIANRAGLDGSCVGFRRTCAGSRWP